MHAYRADTGWIDGPRIADAHGDCHLCGGGIIPGQLIVRPAVLWVHDACLSWPADRWVAWSVGLSDCVAHHLHPVRSGTWCGLATTSHRADGGWQVEGLLWPGPEAARRLPECERCVRRHGHAYTAAGINLLTAGGTTRA